MQERIRFYDERVRECVDRLRAEFDVEAARRRDLARREALLHRPARRAPPAGARRDLLQLGDHADPAPQLLRQRPDLRPRGHLDRVHRVRPADLPQLLPEVDGNRRRASSACSATSAGAGRSPTSSATSSGSSRALAERPDGARVDAPRAEPPDPGAGLGRSTATRPRTCSASSSTATRRAAVRRPDPPRRGRACSSSTRSCSTRDQINILFSLSRAYFMVDMEVPSGYVEFLRSMAPHRDRAPSSTRCSGSASRARRSSSANCCQHLAPLRGRVRRGARDSRQGDARLHAPLVPLRVQGDPRRRSGRGRTPTGRPSARSSRWSSTSTASGGSPTRSSSPTSRCRATASRPSCSSSCTRSRRRWSRSTATRS